LVPYGLLEQNQLNHLTTYAMTKLAMIILVALATCTSCKTITPTNTSTDDSLLMSIDCRNESSTRQTIVMLLRLNRARDIVVTTNDPYLTIKAVFLKRELPVNKLSVLAQDIETTGGVVELRVEENRGAVMQASQWAPTPPLR
jgi:hypothetical protein